MSAVQKVTRLPGTHCVTDHVIAVLVEYWRHLLIAVDLSLRERLPLRQLLSTWIIIFMRSGQRPTAFSNSTIAAGTVVPVAGVNVASALGTP
jgi:hypothetical protein